MACRLTDRSQVSRLVLGVIRDKEDNQNIQEGTRFWQDLRVDKETRRTYFRPIKKDVEGEGCELDKVMPGDFEDAKAVSDIVDMVWKDVKPA